MVDQLTEVADVAEQQGHLRIGLGFDAETQD